MKDFKQSRVKQLQNTPKTFIAFGTFSCLHLSLAFCIWFLAIFALISQLMIAKFMKHNREVYLLQDCECFKLKRRIACSKKIN